MASFKQRPSWWLTAVPIVYLLTLTKSYYWDGVLFSLQSEQVYRHEIGSAILFHPNHLLYTALAFVLYSAVHALGITARSITILQVVNALVGGFAAALLYSTAARTFQSRLVGAFCLVLFAFGATWWKFTTDANAYIISILFLVLAIRFVLGSSPKLFAAGMCHVAAMLFHELAVFAYVPVILANCLDRSQAAAKRVRNAIVYCATTGPAVSLAYEICYQTADHRAYPSLLRWASSYASDSGFTRSVGQIVSVYLSSFGKLFAGGRLSLVRQFLSFAVILGFVVTAVALFVAIREFLRPRASAVHATNRGDFYIILSWFAANALFLAIWDVGSSFHKLFAWPALVLLFGCLIADRPWAAQRVRAFVWLAGGLACWNFAAYIYPHLYASADPVVAFAQQMDRDLPRNATVYYTALSPDDWYLEYFAPGRRWVQLNNARQVGSAACFDTTALNAYRPATDPAMRWALVNRQHNIRIECSR